MNALITRLGNYFSLVRFSHTIFAMPFALLGYFRAINTKGYGFNVRLLILVILCMVFARNAAMGFNRFVDHKYDSINPRTAGREIPSGKISPRSALLFVIINTVLFIITAALINKLAFFLSPVAVIIILGYSITKRFTYLSHIVLGLALSLAPVGAFIAVTGRFDFLPFLYSLIVIFWVSGFDIIYSVQDSDFDSENSLHSIPVIMGPRRSLILSSLLHIFSVACVLAAGILGNSGLIYWTGSVIFALLLTWEHIIARPTDNISIAKAFGTINSYAGITFCAFAITDLYIPLSF